MWGGSLMLIVKKRLSAILIIVLPLALLSFMNDAAAMAMVSVCNDGKLPVAMMALSRYAPFGGKPQLSGWHRLDPGDCYRKNAGMVDLLVGFYVVGSKNNSYYDIEPPKLYKPGLDWVPASDARVERSSRRACVDEHNPFDRKGTESELEQCPAGWVSLPFTWRIWVYPDNDRIVTLHITPTPDKERVP
jgi:hypothetical protein